MKKYIFIIFISLCFINSCSINPSKDYSTLSNNLLTGMTKQEVINILGNPVNKKIEGKKEIYEFRSDSYTAATLGNLVFLPVVVLAQGSVFNGKSSSLVAYFDENGLLESFHAY